jgi:hypothetical protein
MNDSLTPLLDFINLPINPKYQSPLSAGTT